MRYADKCENTKLIIPNVEEALNIQHIICYRGPVVFRTDDENQFFDDISLYFPTRSTTIILKRIDEENYQILTSFQTSIFKIKKNELQTRTPQSTFNTETIAKEMGTADKILKFQYVCTYIYIFAI